MSDQDKERRYIEKLPQAFARHRIVTGEDGKPIDYIFLEVNAAFEKMTGLLRDKILGQKVTTVLPGIENNDFDWIGVYGKVALEGEPISCEQYSEPLGRWYDVTAYSDEPGHFITVFNEITARKEELASMKSLLQLTEKLINTSAAELDYQELADSLKRLSGAKFVVLSTYEEGNTKTIARAIAGVPSAVNRITDILGFDLTGHAWEITPDSLRKIKGGKLVHFSGLYETAMGVLTKSTALLLENTFNFGDIYIICLAFGEIPPLGDVIFFMPRNRTIQNREAIELYAGQVGSLLERVRAEKEMDIIYKQYEDVVNTQQELICRFKPDTMLTFANKAYCQYFNLTDKDIGHKKFLDLVPEKEHEKIRKHLQTLSETKKPVSYEHEVFAGGKVKWQRWTDYPLADENGEVTGFQSHGWDITERKQAEELLNMQNAMLRTQLEVSPDGIFVVDENEKIISYNQNFCDIWGIPGEIMTLTQRKKALDYVLPKLSDPEEFASRIHELYDNRQEKSYEEISLKDGRVLERYSAPMFGDEGQYYGRVWYYRDITERKQAEEALQESENRFNLAISGTGAGLWDWDMVNDKVFFSTLWKTMLGYADHEIENAFSGWQKLWHPEDAEKVKKAIQDHLDGKTEKYEIEHRLLHKDGSWRHILTRGDLIKDDNGKPVRWVGTNLDLTHIKEMEEALRASEKKYREILSTIEESYYEVDLAGNFVFCNDSFCKDSGYSQDELMQGSYIKFFKNPQEVFQAYNRVYRTGIAEKAVDWPLITKDGREIIVEGSIALRRDEAGNPIGFRGIARDITERRLAEEKLHDYEKLQQLLMNMATDLINVPLEKVDQAINEMLGAVGDFAKVDRAYIFKHDYNRRVTTNTHEWCAEGITPEIDNLQEFPFERFIEFLETNQKGEIVNIPDVARMPATHAMRSLFEAQGIQSLILLPLFSEDVNTGFVGFDAVKQKKIFTDQEINLLKVLAEITSNVMARQKAEANIRHISFHDQLTGLYNRHYLEIEMARLNTKRQLPLAVIMADVNGLKLVNDTYGHGKGDEMLKTAATIIKNSCREEDIIARWGGDEFVILLPQTTEETARLICQRIAESCQNSVAVDVPVSFALGAAVKTFMAKDLAETLSEAEDEMYKQKLTASRSAKSAVVKSLLNTLAAKSFETEEHTRGMQKIAQQIGANLNLPDSELHRLDLLITLHDIGKINIPEAILTKNSSLTDDEWEAIKKHPEIGSRIAMATEEFSHVAEDILTHHERWDGSGYPQGLKGEVVPLLARITAIADAYEVMSHGRPYKKAMSKNEIIAEFRRCSGSQFDPRLTEIFLVIIANDG
jgi:diguanylate cyclase (GGDEF)-like protein/PAS domain S-box-containing protein